MHLKFWMRAAAGAAVLATALLPGVTAAAAQGGVIEGVGSRGALHREGRGVRVDLLGVRAEPLTSGAAEELGLDRSTQGAVVTEVATAGAGDRGGLEAGDIITAVEGHAVDTGHSLLSRVSEVFPAEHLRLGLIRDGKPLTLEISLIPGVG